MRAPRAALAPAPAQDLYKQLAAPHGSQLLLRLRCHSDLQVARHYGNLQPDAEVAQLYHLAGCHAHTTIAFDLEFASGSGFDITLMSWAVAMANDPSPPKVISFSYGHDEADLARTTMDIFNVEAMKLGVQVPRRSAGHPMKPRARLHAQSQRWPR